MVWCGVCYGRPPSREELVGKAVRKMMNRQLAAAWDCWKDKYLTWRDYVMPKLKLAAGRMMNRIAAVAFISNDSAYQRISIHRQGGVVSYKYKQLAKCMHWDACAPVPGVPPLALIRP